ncbi:MAG: PQQ-like beta-propeller repeat protein [Acidobacteria bacterium]|nr:PQQ-like beta-propeller repeat protein [Acidobacteriota bacterium]
MHKSVLVATAMVVAAVVAHAASDSTQWQGPNRTRLSPETGLLREWPAGGPAVVWTARGLGAGFGSMNVAGDRVFVQGVRNNRSVVIALNRADGKEVWSKALGPTQSNNMGSGPRGTPAVDDDRIYVLTENGDLACLKTDGTAVWQRNILQDFGGRQIQWLISESPLIDGAHVVVTPGGRGAGMVKLDKMTGQTVWASKELSDTAGYSSVVAADVQGVRTYFTFTASAGVGVRASDGKLMFSYPRAANRTANITTPVYSNNKVLFTSGYGTGAGLLDLSVKDGVVSATESYFTLNMKNHHGGVVLVDGYLYGFNDAILTCMEFATGNVMWRDRSVGKGTVTYADGHLYVLGEGNTVGLVEATPAGYREKGRFNIPDTGLPSWAHLVVSDGRLYLRNQDTLTTFQVKAAERP